MFKKDAIDLINNHCERIEKITIIEFLERFVDLIQKLFDQNLFFIYPEPIIYKFIKMGLRILDKIQAKNFIKFIVDILPEFNTSVFITGKRMKVVILLKNSNSKTLQSELTLKIFTPEEIEVKIDESNVSDSLYSIQNKLNTLNAYYLHQKDIISYLSDFFELSIPIRKENLKLLFQKALFGYRSFEKHWDMIPRPKIYNASKRFLIRLFGFNVNLRKISHWSIPNVIFNYLDFYFGLNSRILLIITNLEATKKLKVSRERLSKSMCKHTFLFEFEESTLTKLRRINIEEFFSREFESLKSIINQFTEKYGAISAIIKVDKLLIENIVKTFFFEHSEFSLFPRLKTLKLMKNERYFTIYPQFPFYKLIMKMKPLSILKLFLPIIIDKHEF